MSDRLDHIKSHPDVARRADRDWLVAEVDRLRDAVVRQIRYTHELEDRIDTLRGVIEPLCRAAAGQFLAGDEASEDNLRLLSLVAELSSESVRKPPVELTGDWLKRDRKWTPPDWIETETL
jgi:hypothetical protein